ncbi:M15 family metallopeptidase [Enterovibrio norvegicus]|uniref:M15 family metallopeptidase n=1 Tax=Enterovibrio norvegicus TaxID=188144 RepID=UPI0013D36918|nr:M15 family metallopeptidase [Enterovibrio norvegicus]
MHWSVASLTGQTQEHLVSHGDFLLHADVKADFIRLQTAAQAAGFELAIASSFRDFARQQMIWNNKFMGLRPILDDTGTSLDPSRLSDDEKVRAILRWSALPGASRHHWGTDIDVYSTNLLPQSVSLQLEPWEYLSGHQAPLFAWLEDNLEQYGFYLPYREDKGGVAFEPWHISHKATTQGLLEQLTPETLSAVIASSDIQGRETILPMLNWIYSQYISNVCEA